MKYLQTLWIRPQPFHLHVASKSFCLCTSINS